MAEKKVIKVALVFNAFKEGAPEKLKYLETFVPKTSCDQEIRQFFGTDITEISAGGLQEFDPDLIIHYGLGNGLLWQNNTIYKAQVLLNDNTLSELMDHVLYDDFFPIIKAAISKIDSVFSRPENLNIAKTKADLEYLRDRCFKEEFGFDTETNFLNPFIESPVPQLLCYSLAWLSNEEEGWCIPCNQALIESGLCEYTKEDSLKLAEDIFFVSTVRKYCHNGGYDLIALYELFGKEVINFAGDTMLLLNQYHNAIKSVALKNNTELVNLPAYKDPIKDWLDSANQKAKRGQKLGWDAVPLDIIGPYAAMDAIAVVRLVNFLLSNLERDQIKFYRALPHKIMVLGNKLAIDGYEISRDRYTLSKISLEHEIRNAYDEVIKNIHKYITPQFNINSNDQMGEILFSKLKLPILQKTKGGSPSVDVGSLDNLILFHPVIFKLIKYKKLNKLYTSYVTGYQGSLGRGSRHRTTGSRWVFNSSMKQINRTARLSASNMQTDEKKGRGGNILVLPSAGSYVKHYFEPKEVVKLENELYDMILEASPEAKSIVAQTVDYNVEDYVAPAPPVKIPKPPKPPKQIKIKVPRKKKADATGSTEGSVVSEEGNEQESIIKE